MTRTLIVTLIAIAFPALTVSAQSVESLPGTGAAAQLQTPVMTSALAAAAAEQGVRQPGRQPAPPARAPGRTRRRGSMVGYIEDPIVSSKVRIRFEGASDNPSPDRAEFFYAKCGCYRDLPPDNTAYDPNAPGPRPGAASNVNFKQLFVMGEFATSDQLSVFAELPVRWLQPQAFIPNTGGSFEDQTGVGDIRAGAKFGFASDAGQAFTAQLKLFMPTGDAAKGLGTDHWSFEPALLAYRELSDIVTVEGQIALWLPFGGADGVPITRDEKFAGQVFTYGIGPSVTVYQTDRMRIAPVVELVGWHVFGGFQTGIDPPDAEANTVNIKIGGRVSWDRAAGANAGSIYVGYGKALTDAKWYDDILRVEYRVGF